MRALLHLFQQVCHLPAASGDHLLIVQQPPRLASFLTAHPCTTIGGRAAARRSPAYWVRGGAQQCRTAASDAASPGAAGEPLLLIIYSKEGCHLCDSLKTKVEALLDRAEFAPCALTGGRLEVRDITSNPAWEQAFSMTIPVLAAARLDGSGEVGAVKACLQCCSATVTVVGPLSRVHSDSLPV